MFVAKKWQRFLAKTLILLLLFANPGAAAAENKAADTADSIAITVDKDTPDKEEQSQTVTLTLDKGDTEEAHAAFTSAGDTDKNLTGKEKALTFTNSLWAYFLKNGKNSGPQWLKTADFSFQLNDNNKPVYSFETIQPFGEVNKNGALWFWQGRYANQGNSSNTANLGVGWRKLAEDKKSLFGLNAFYDYGFQYKLARVGVGTEYFNKQAEYRFNWYHPVSGDRQTGVSYLDSGILYSYIRAVEGFDFELGTAVPDAPWWKVYAGGFYWDNKHNADEKGYKLRSAMQLTPRFSLEVGYTKSNQTSDAYGKIMYNLADVNGLSFWDNLASKVDGKDIIGVTLQIYKDGKPVGEPIFMDADKLSRYTVKATYVHKTDKVGAPIPQPTDDLTAKLLQKVARENDIKTETWTKLVPYTGSVKVTVTDGTNPISGASVSVTIGSTAYTATTDAVGVASFASLKTGSYTFTASATGYTSATAAIAVTDSGGSGTIVLGGQALTITATSGTGGSITPSGATSVTYGGSQTYTFTPVTGYSIASVTVDGTTLATTPTSYTFTNVTTAHTIAVTYDTTPSYLITVTTPTNGTISPSVNTYVTSGDSLTFYFTPDAGYVISSVTVDGTSLTTTPTAYTFSNVTAAHSISVALPPPRRHMPSPPQPAATEA